MVSTVSGVTFLRILSSASPLPEDFLEQVKLMKWHYRRILEVEGDVEEWMECLKALKDHQFVCHNVEDRIGHDLDNQGLWKLYIEYLRSTDSKEMLQVYSKYCRYFLDDEAMKEEYKKEVEKHGPVFVTWKNRFSFESAAIPNPTVVDWDLPFEWIFHLRRNNIDTNAEYLPKIPNSIPPMNPTIIQDFFENHRIPRQSWSLPLPLIRDILDRARPVFYKRLQKTCKFLWFYKPKLYCHNFVYTDYLKGDVLYCEESLRLTLDCAERILKSLPKKLIVTWCLDVTRDLSMEPHLSPLPTLTLFPRAFLSTCIQHLIYEADIKYLNVSDQDISDKDLEFLTMHGNLETFVYFWGYIFESSNKNVVPLENILKLVPRIREFR